MLHDGAALIAAALVAVAGACSKDAKPSEPSCDDRVDRFAEHLAPLVDRGVGMLIPPEISPVVSTRGRSVDRYGPVVVVAADGALTLQGQRVADEDELRERLAAELEVMRMSEREGPLYIWADARTPAATVARVAATAPGGLETRLLLAAPEVAPSPYQRELLANPKIAKLYEQLRGGDASRKAVMLAENMESAIGMCTPMIKAFGAVAGMDAARKGPFMADAAPKALRQCKCEVGDIDMFEFGMLAILGAFDREVTWIPATDAATVLSN